MKKNEYNSLDDIPDILLLGNIGGIEVPLFLSGDQARILKKACKFHRKSLEDLIVDLANKSMERR